MVRVILRASLCIALCTMLAAGMVHAQSITFIGSTTSSDYSDSGLDLGNAGFWFANFAATTPVDGAAIDSNDRNSLPSWVSLDPTPDTTFAGTASTSGGHTPWAFLTLPDGENGLSGAVVDSNTNNNSNNTIRELNLGPGTPNRFYFHVVTDNTAGEHDPAGRLRARAEHHGGLFDISAISTPPGLATNMDGSPDVYTWLYEGVQNNAYIKLQLNSADAFAAASIAGIMFDPIPEPSSTLLLVLGAVGCAGGRFRRRG